MQNIIITYVTIGGARLAVTNNRDRDNNASTLLISCADVSKLVEIIPSYNMVVTLSGVPLSMSLYTDPDIDPSSSINQIHMFYAIDVVINTEEEDAELDPSVIGNIPIDPSDKTFTWNGNRLSASKIDNKYYMNVYDTGETGNASNHVILMGTPMAQGTQDELIINKTNYTISQIEQYRDILIGGVPLQAGRIGNNYYLIVKILS